jgi:uncharacterized protein
MHLWLLRLLFALLPTFLCTALQAQDLQSVPILSSQVHDLSGTLSSAEQSVLAAKLAALQTQTGTQLVVLMVPTLGAEDIADYAQRVGESWKLGRRKEGDGLIIIVAKNDRKIRIQVAKALEGAVPDVAAAHIIQTHMTTAFKANDYAGGLGQAIDALSIRIQKENTNPTPTSDTAPNKPVLLWLLAIPLMGIFFVVVVGRKIGVLLTGALTAMVANSLTATLGLSLAAAGLAMLTVFLFNIFTRNTAAPVVSRRSGSPGNQTSSLDTLGNILLGAATSVSHGSSWGGGGGGNSFSSGGGGDFGGGGASGDW